jgi:aminoglycoside phosphotransferase
MMSVTTSAPDAELAAAIATRVTARAPVSVRRFTTGARHYVFDVAFGDRPPIVVRIGDPSARGELAGGLSLSRLLRPLGAPLPAILAADIESPFPWMAMERLPGADLAEVMNGLSSGQLSAIAAEVARAQAIAAQTGSAGRYGYASLPEQAPHRAWRDVLEDNFSRSRARIASADLFDPRLVDIARSKLAKLRQEIEAIAPTPFLHDATTRNVIVAPDGAFSGIVDVDDLCYGDARYTAALTLAVLTAYGGPIEYVAFWMRQAKQQDDRLFQLYVALFLLDLMGEHGQVFNGNQAPSTPGARAKLLTAFDERLALIG